MPGGSPASTASTPGQGPALLILLLFCRPVGVLFSRRTHFYVITGISRPRNWFRRWRPNSAPWTSLLPRPRRTGTHRLSLNPNGRITNGTKRINTFLEFLGLVFAP